MRIPRSLHWRIAAAYTALIFVTMGAVSIFLINFVNDRFVEDLEDRLLREANLIGQTPGIFDADEATNAAVDRFGQSIRGHVTVFDAGGTVVADSAGPSGPSVPVQPEITQALNGRATSIVRSAEVFGGDELRYSTVPVEVGGSLAGVVRVGVPTSTVTARVNTIIITVVAAAAAVALLSVALGWYVARRTTRSMLAVTAGARQLAAGNLDHRVPALGTDESRNLAVAFNRMARTIRSTVTALEGERSKLSAVLDTMDDGVIVAGADGEVTLVNPAAESLLGESARGEIGSRLSGAVWDHDLIQLVREAIRTGEPCYGEVDLSFSKRTVSAVATPVKQRDADGVLLTLHDLTRRRIVDTTRREFVSNVSHELRSPLASVKAMVETLQSGASGDADKASEFLGRINGEIDRMTALVTELLELSRLESGQIAMDTRPFELGPVVSEVVDRLHQRAQAGGVTVETGIPPGLPSLAGESAKISQVLFNLVDNALRFTPESGRVEIAAERMDGFVAVRVADTGPGISQEHLPHLFERFYKVDRSRREGGIGLGLAIVRHIVLAHGGEVSVDSEIGRGACFRFTVPVA